MRRSDTYTGFDFSNTWKLGTYGEYPEFLTENDSKEGLSSFKFFEGGDGSKDNPYIIATEDQFLAISELRKIEYYYKLKNDLILQEKINRPLAILEA